MNHKGSVNSTVSTGKKSAKVHISTPLSNSKNTSNTSAAVLPYCYRDLLNSKQFTPLKSEDIGKTPGIKLAASQIKAYY